jgi:lysophospholipase L1-like esterase
VSPPSATIGRRLIFSLAMLSIAFGTAELLARVLGREVLELNASPKPSADEDNPNLMGNPYLLYELAPGERFEKGIEISINSYGIRGPEWSAQKPDGVRRVMALGDSSVYGFGVEDDQVFTALMDDALGAGVEVINSAVPGYSTYQIINLLEIRSLSLQPDLLLVGCIWSDNNFDSFVDRELLAAYSSFRNQRARWLHHQLERSALFSILDYKLRVLRKFPEERRVGWMLGRGEKVGSRRVPIDEYARNLETISELAERSGAELAFMVLPNREDLVSSHDSGAAWDPYRQVMRDTAARHGAPLMELPAHYVASGLSADDLFLDEMHPTAKGHQIWADLALSTLAERGWTEGDSILRDPAPGPIPDYSDPFVEGHHAPPPDEAAAMPSPGEEVRESVQQESPPAGGSTAAWSVSGTLLVPQEHDGIPVQLDVMEVGASQPVILGTRRLTNSGAFVVLLNKQVDRVAFIAYLDTEGDGPGAGDMRIELHSAGLALPDEGKLEGVELDLSEGVITQTFGEGEAPPPQEGEPTRQPIVTDQPPGSMPDLPAAATTSQPGVIVTDQSIDSAPGRAP